MGANTPARLPRSPLDSLKQLREVLPGSHPYRFAILDRDCIFSRKLDREVAAIGVEAMKTPVRAPQANSACEGMVGSGRRECLDLVMPLGERHLRQVFRNWTAHYNQCRFHMSLGPGIPAPLRLEVRGIRKTTRMARLSMRTLPLKPRYRPRRVGCPRCGVRVEDFPLGGVVGAGDHGSVQLLWRNWRLSWQGTARQYRLNWKSVVTIVKRTVEHGLKNQSRRAVAGICSPAQCGCTPAWKSCLRFPCRS